MLPIQNPMNNVAANLIRAARDARALHDRANAGLEAAAKAVREHLPDPAAPPPLLDPRRLAFPTQDRPSSTGAGSFFGRAAETLREFVRSAGEKFGFSVAGSREAKTEISANGVSAGAAAWMRGAFDASPFGARAAAELGAQISAGITIVDATIGSTVGGTDVGIELRNRAGADLGAHAGAFAELGRVGAGLGIGAGAEAFLGARMTDTQTVGLDANGRNVAHAEGTAEAWVGMGFLGEGSFRVDERERIHIEGGIGAAFGIGSAFRGEVTFG